MYNNKYTFVSYIVCQTLKDEQFWRQQVIKLHQLTTEKWTIRASVISHTKIILDIFKQMFILDSESSLTYFEILFGFNTIANG